MPERQFDINEALPIFVMSIFAFLFLFSILKSNFSLYFNSDNSTYIISSIIGSFLVLILTYTKRRISIYLFKISVAFILLFPFITLIILVTVFWPIIVNSYIPFGIPSQEMICNDINGISRNISFYFKCQNPSGINYIKVGNYLSCGIGFNSNIYNNTTIRIRGNYKTPSGHIIWMQGLGNQSYWEEIKLNQHIPYFQTDNLNETGTYSIGFDLFDADNSCSTFL